MRLLLFTAIISFSLAVKAQTVLSPNAGNKLQTEEKSIATVSQAQPGTPPKWFITKYAGFNTGFSFFKGGNAFITSLPVGVQHNRQITNNLFGFAGVQVTPSYVNFNQSFLTSNFSKYGGVGGLNQNKLLLPSRAELGLMYVNDQRTFSISGSISVQKSNYPLLPYYQPATFSMPYYHR